MLIHRLVSLAQSLGAETHFKMELSFSGHRQMVAEVESSEVQINLYSTSVLYVGICFSGNVLLLFTAFWHKMSLLCTSHIFKTDFFNFLNTFMRYYFWSPHERRCTNRVVAVLQHLRKRSEHRVCNFLFIFFKSVKCF